MQDALEDTTDSLDLERIKNKVTSAYRHMLEQAFKKNNPVGSPEDLEKYLELHALSFGPDTGDFDEDSHTLEDMLDRLLKQDDIKPVAEGEKIKLNELVKRRKRAA